MSQTTLAKVAQPVDQSEVKKRLLLHYGLRGELTAITGERDHNYVLQQSDGSKVIVKVAHEDEDFATLDFQSQAIATITKNAPRLAISQEIKNLHNQKVTQIMLGNSRSHFMRVNSFVPGVALSDVPRTAATRKSIGAFTANLALALKDFSHSAQHRALLWDIQQAASLAPHVETLPTNQRTLVAPVLSHFLTNILPFERELRPRVIHNDLNLHNLFVDPNDHSIITGCIDFGDMVRAPLVNDLAIATAYQINTTDDPLSAIAETAGTKRRPARTTKRSIPDKPPPAATPSTAD